MGSRILIVDPDTRALSLTASGLRKDGFEPLVASRGEDALSLLLTQPALVLAEVSVPGVDGLTLCERVRAEPATREIPFLLLARKDEESHRDKARKARADDYFVKPLYVRDVCTLARLFAGRRAGETLLKGDLAQTPLFFLLRALTSGFRSGVVHLPSEKGTVYFRDGRIIDAAAGELEGEQAVARLLVLAEGPFRLEFCPVLLRGSMSYSLRDLVTHDEPRRRRFEHAVALMGGQDAKLAIEFKALTRELPGLPPSIEKIVRLFDGTRTLGEALRSSDLDEVTSAEAILRLVMLKVLRPVEELSKLEKLPAPGQQPRLFEPRSEEPGPAMDALFPRAEPILVPELPQSAPGEVRDWFTEFARRDGFHDILSSVGGLPQPPAPREPAPAPAPAPQPAAPQPAAAPARAEGATAGKGLIVAGLVALASGLAVVALKQSEPPPAASAPAAAEAPAAKAGPPAVPALAESAPPPPAPAEAAPSAQAEPSSAVPAAGDDAPASPGEPAAPKTLEQLLAEGRALLEQGKPEAALEPLQAAAGLAPGRAEVLVPLARAFLGAGKAEHAEVAARRALESGEPAAGAHLVLGAVNAGRGKTAQAREQYEAYLKLEPSGPRADEARAALAGLR